VEKVRICPNVCVPIHSSRSTPATNILSQFAPCFHGLYRAIISTPFAWTAQEWIRLAHQLNQLFSPEVVDGLNRLLVDVLRNAEEDPESVMFVQTFLARYISRGRPLSGHFIVCCVIESQWTILTQALIPDVDVDSTAEFAEAAAANKAWQTLVAQRVPNELERDQSFNKTAQDTFGFAMQCYTDLLIQIEEMDTEPSEDSYAWETMSESLVG
jgi:phosphatidylinositol 4-kinase A